MTTSGQSSFNFNRDQIIKAALRKVNAIESGETPGSQLVQDCADQLNMMVKAWDATGLHIWTEEEAVLFVQPSQISYTLGGTTTDQCALSSYTATTLSASAAQGATSISVTSASGFAASYYVGVVLDSGSISWTTESGPPSGTTISLSSGLSGSASSGSAVYVYQTQIVRPLRIVSGRRYNIASAIDTPLMPLSRVDYRNMPNKNASGVVTQFFYDPRGGANTQGILWVWPAPPDTTNAIKFTWWRPIQDFTTSANTSDLPQEWLDCIVWNLALKMAPEFGVNPAIYGMIKEHAIGAMDLVMGYDREPESYFFGFNTDQTGP